MVGSYLMKTIGCSSQVRSDKTARLTVYGFPVNFMKQGRNSLVVEVSLGGKKPPFHSRYVEPLKSIC